MRRLTVSATCCALILTACGGPVSTSSGHRHGSVTQATASGITTTASTVRKPARRRRHRHHADPGRLPQTQQLPTAHSRQFHHQMADLWAGITGGRLRPALPAFFPEAAYAQIKAIANPAADWQSRLVGSFAADISAAHALLGARAPGATLMDVRVPAGYAHWVAPGTCHNRVGYWETPNSRLVYRDRGPVRSFGIASMISWRGVWYVVHLGAVLRSGAGGVVDDPSSGPGYSTPSSTC